MTKLIKYSNKKRVS